MRTPMRWAMIGLVGILAPLSESQQPRIITLKPANGTVEGEFSSILSIRELADGRVLIYDRPIGQPEKLLVGDFATGSTKQVGRMGDGPGEYRELGPLFGIAGDTTIMAAGSLWYLLHSAKIVAQVNRDAKVFALPRFDGAGAIHGADLAGNVLALITSPFSPKQPEIDDSTYLVRISRTTGKGDTIGRMPPPPWRRNRQRHTADSLGQGPVGSIGSEAMDRALMFPDGWVAVLRVQPYRVEWWRPGGKLVRGSPLPFDERSWKDADKKTFMEWTWMHWERNQPIPVEASTGWPERFPPNTPLGSILATPQGDLLVSRIPDGTSKKARFDIVNRAGKLAGWIERPLNERVVGFGSKSIYLIVVDEDHVQKLVRHPWP